MHDLSGDRLRSRSRTDAELVARVRDGDVSAFELIVDHYRAPLVALAAARLGSAADAEDAAQDAFVQAFFRLHQLREPEALLAWLRRLVERQALTRLRKRREELLPPVALEQVRLAQEQAGSDGGTGLLLRRLPEAMRETVTLTYLAGYTCAEAAALLGVREGTVKSRLSRARAILKEAFEMAEDELAKSEPTEQFTRETIDKLLREAQARLERGDFEAAGARADRVLEAQAKQYFAAGNPPGFEFDAEAARISGLAIRERRRKDCEANAAQYGYDLTDLDWELADVDVMQNTLGRSAGAGRDLWGIPFSRQKVKMLDARDICRRLECGPRTLHAWVQEGCPTLRCWPFVRFDLDRVKQWLKERGVTTWPKESDADTDRPLRLVLRDVYEREVTAEEALKIIGELDLNW